MNEWMNEYQPPKTYVHIGDIGHYNDAALVQNSQRFDTIALLQIHCWRREWKSFENRITFHEIMKITRWLIFCTTLYNCTNYTHHYPRRPMPKTKEVDSPCSNVLLFSYNFLFSLFFLRSILVNNIFH